MSNEEIAVFDRHSVRRHRDRAAAELGRYDFLLRVVADRLADRLLDFARPFPVALELGAHGGQFAAVRGSRGGIERLIQTDLSARMLSRANGMRAVCDEEHLPFASGRFDLVLSNLSLHWINDLPGALIQARRCLKPDGLFMTAMLGEETLTELRQSLLVAEAEISGGVSPRVSPMAGLRDAGALMQRAGFALPVVDSDRITLTFTDPFALMHELRGLGETNAVRQRLIGPTRRELFARAAIHYHERFADAEGRIPATFDILYLTGWAPHESQQQPLKPGSATSRLADALDAEEKSAGEKAGGSSFDDPGT